MLIQMFQNFLQFQKILLQKLLKPNLQVQKQKQFLHH